MVNMNKSNKMRSVRKPWKLYMAISFAGLVFVLLMSLGSNKAVHLIKEHSTVFNALSNIENEVNDSHIWYSAIFSDKDNNLISKAEKHISNALEFVGSLTKKDTIEQVVYYPLGNDFLIKNIDSLSVEIKKIRTIGEKYFAVKKQSGYIEMMPAELTKQLKKVSKSIENLTTLVRNVTADGLNKFEITRDVIIILFIIFQMLLLLSVHIYNKHRKEDYVLINEGYKKLQETNVNLEIAEKIVKENEKIYKTLVEKSPVGIHELDADGNFISINEVDIKLRKYSKTDEIIGTSYFDFVSEPDRERIEQLFKYALAGKVSEFEYNSVKKNNHQCIISANFIPLLEESGNVIKVMGVTQDITERKTNQVKLIKANLLYSILSEINQAIVRINNTQELYDNICKIFVELGKFKIAWIGLFNYHDNKFEPVSFYGNAKKYVNKLNFSLDDLTGSSLKIAENVLANNIVILNNLNNREDETIWRESSIESGFGSGAVVPFTMYNKVIGSLSVSSTEVNYFGEEEEGLLKEIGLDISFAIEKIESDNKRKHAEEAILNIEKGISSSVGSKFFDTIVESLNKTIGAYTTYIGEYHVSGTIKLLSVFGDKRLPAEKIYNLDGTPCKFVISEGKFVFNGNLASNFPDDKLLEEMNIESYFGFRLMDSNNNIIGIVVSLYTEKIEDEDFVSQVYNIFSSRIASELERKYVFDSLVESEKRYQNLYQQSNDAIYLLYNNKFEIINNKFTELFGYTLDEVNSDDFHFMKLISPKSKDVIEDRIKRSLNGEKLSPIYEFIALTKDGREIECEASVTYIDYKESRATQGIIRNITARKKALLEIENSEKSYRELFDNNDDAIYLQDKDGRFVSVNKGAVNMYGYPREYFIGKTPELLSAPDKNDIQAVQEMISKAWEGEPQSFEFWGQRKNGEIFPKEVRLRKGSYFGKEVVIAFARDITEAKRKEEMVKASELRYRSLFESSADSILLFYNEKIIDCNPKALTMFGCSRNQIVGKSPLEFSPTFQPNGEISADMAMKNFGRFYEGENFGFEWEFTTYHGTSIITDINLSRIQISGKIIIYAIVRDITEKKRAEKELVTAREKAEASDKLKSEFLSQISHEIRTPINTMLSFTSLIKYELEDKVSNDLKESFKGIGKAGKRIVRTTDLILNMSELQTNSYDYRPKEINLRNDIFSKLEAEFIPLAKEKDLTIKFNYNSDSISIYADEYTVTQIFSNLIDNAIKYTKSGEVQVSCSKVNSSVVVDVTDTGIGISEKFLPSLFEVFSQEEQGYTRSFEGNGLGMALVKQYCDMNNADIKVKSEKGKGTTFTVTFEIPKAT